MTTINSNGYIVVADDISSSLNTTTTIAATSGASTTTAGVNAKSGNSLTWTLGAGGSATTGTGGDGGDFVIQGGAGGAANTTAGAGGDVQIKAGAGGATNGAGGNIVIQPGAGNGTGLHGAIIVNIPSVAASVDCSGGGGTEGTATAKQLLSGYLEVGTGAGAGYALKMPTAVSMKAAIPGCQVGSSFFCVLVNVVAQICTVTANADGKFTADGTVAIANDGSSKLFVVCKNAGAAPEFVAMLC